MYGVKHAYLECPLDGLNMFDLTRDLPSDILHHFTLGWYKKAVETLKNDFLSKENLDHVCAILDSLEWKEYKCRTTSSSLRAVGSQIGRNIKSLSQVLWYALYLLVKFDEDGTRDKLGALWTIFYLSKLSYLFHNENETVWTSRLLLKLQGTLRRVTAFFHREMPDIMRGPKSHDLEHHLEEDIVAHGNPAGYDCNPGESKMRVMKLKNQFSNKGAPSSDVAIKILRTEVVRHVFSGGKLNETGTESAGPKVLQEAVSFQSFRLLLGIKEPEVQAGKVSLQDWLRGKVKKIRPEPNHIALGVPDELMRTCRKVATKCGPLFRSGGFSFLHQGTQRLCILRQVLKDNVPIFSYKTNAESTYAVGELMTPTRRTDPFLQEMDICVYKKSGLQLIVEDLHQIFAVPILHACAEENTVVCGVERSPHSVTEERQELVQTSTHFNCRGRQGKYFFVNPLAFSVSVDSVFSPYQ